MQRASIYYLPIPHYPDALLLYFSFLPSLSIFKQQLLEYKYDGIHQLVLQGRAIETIPSEYLEFLLEYKRIMKEEGRDIYFVEMHDLVQDSLQKIGFSESDFFDSVASFVASVLQNE